jgi:flagellar biosynthesis/type III secretory pathway protein FliH
MEKQTVVRAGKALNLLLLILFIISVACAAVSANTDISKFGPISKKIYLDGYNRGFHDGSTAGYTAGMKDGYSNCQKGLYNKVGSGREIYLVLKNSSTFDLGYTDGFNNGYLQGQSAGYQVGHNSYHQIQTSRKPG